MTKLSIIVPVYNVERYVAECLRSILNQSFQDYEVIIINDGSTDKSLNICKEFESSDNRIVVFDTPNRGVSAARNLGLQHCRGEFITFVDPDDLIESHMYQEMYSQLVSNDTDICMCGYNTFNSKEKTMIKLTDTNKLLFEKEIRDYLIPNLIGPRSLNSGDQTIMGSVCRLLIKRDVIFENNLKFREELPLMEDLVFCIELFLKVKKVIFMEECFYNYRMNDQSAVHQVRINLLELQMMAYNYLIDITKRYDLYLKYKLRFEYRYCQLYLATINNVVKSTKMTYKEKIAHIDIYCSDKELNNIINDLDFKNYTIRKRVSFYLIKNKKFKYIYIYYKILNWFV